MEKEKGESWGAEGAADHFLVEETPLWTNLSNVLINVTK